MTRWVRFRLADGETGIGTLEGEGIVEHEGELFHAATPTGKFIRAASVRLLPPCRPGKIVALWNNFHALAAKLEKQTPVHPLFLIKPGSSLAGPDDIIMRPSGYGGRIAFEGELGIVIGRECFAVSTAEAEDRIFGYTCVNDVTAVDILNENPDFPQWCRSKGYATFGCLGPAIASDLEWAKAWVVTSVDGVERQNYPLADMIFSPAEQVSHISHDMTLYPGDVIACGTSLGVGSLKPGSRVAVSIEGIGTLTNTLPT